MSYNHKASDPHERSSSRGESIAVPVSKRASPDFHWPDAALAGIVAGVVATVFQVGCWWLAGEPAVALLFRDARLTAAIVMGPRVLPPPSTFDASIFVVATLVHFALSIAYGLVLCAAAVAGRRASRSIGARGRGRGFRRWSCTRSTCMALRSRSPGSRSRAAGSPLRPTRCSARPSCRLRAMRPRRRPASRSRIALRPFGPTGAAGRQSSATAIARASRPCHGSRIAREFRSARGSADHAPWPAAFHAPIPVVRTAFPAFRRRWRASTP